MKKEIKVKYSKIGNMGDLLNELVIEDVLGFKVIHSDIWKSETTAIGSYLRFFFHENTNLTTKSKIMLKKLYGQFQPPLQIWSTGFITYSDKELIPIRKEINVASVRGELTRKRLEKILNKELNVPTGDGGLLASHLLKGPIEKKYSIGIIPHFREKDEKRFLELKEAYNNSVVIDLTDDPLNVVKTISQCEVIISSALHGLIVADSFGIPNKRLIYTNNLLGDGYKFDDYYSGFNIKVDSFDLNNPGNPTINEIIDGYKVTETQVEAKKGALYKSFTKYL
ncbi:polysaccharide pyruvyl transferase family protein [Anaerobacillus alkaliphilus]|nr:polysaccharide pyruvyl transferase family protein [Anaerobacillus alkaliphilus]